MHLSGKVAGDASAILSVLIGGKASKVFAKAKGVRFVTVAGVAKETQEYIPILAKKKVLNRNAM